MGANNGRGFTISYQLSPHGITFNIPPFIEGRAQLPADKVRSGCKLLHCEYILRGLLEEYHIERNFTTINVKDCESNHKCVRLVS